MKTFHFLPFLFLAFFPQFMFSQNISDWFAEGGLSMISSSIADYYCIDTDTIATQGSYTMGTDPVVWGYTVNRISGDTADFEILVTTYDVYNGAASGTNMIDSSAAVAFNRDSTMDISTAFYKDLSNKVALQINFFEYGTRTNVAFSPGSGGTPKLQLVGISAPNFNHGVGRLHAAEMYRFDNLNSAAAQTYFLTDTCTQLDILTIPPDTIAYGTEDISSSWLATQEGLSAYPYDQGSDVVFFHTMEKTNLCDANTNNRLETSEATYNILFSFTSSVSISRQDISKSSNPETGQRSSIGFFVDSIAYVKAVLALDIDEDDDGIPDTIESGGNDPDGDEDGDGLPNYLDNLDGGNGGDGSTTDYTDSNGDGIPDVYDADGDGISNHLDLDADNDGIPDIIEAGGVDTDGNGIVDNIESDGSLTNDSDGDGLADIYDANNGGAAIANNDLDGDGLPNALDLDSDNDGILDIVEADGPSADANGDGYVDDYNPGTGTFGGSGDGDSDGYSNEYDSDTNNDFTIDNAQSLNSGAWVSGPLILTGADTDVDGLPDSYGNGDADSDIHPDFMDVDADNDGILDNIEAQATGQAGTRAYVPSSGPIDSKGVPTVYGTYTNYDTDNSTSLGTSYGINPYDHDGDGTPDYKDTDSDDDGDPDVDEAWDSNLDGNGTSDYSCTTDVDGDGLLSCFDTDDNDITAYTNANDPPVDNGFESSLNNGATAASSFGSMNGTSVFYYDVFPNNNGDQGDIQPDWRDVGCAVGAALQYPITGTDAIYSGGVHASDPPKQVGAIRATDYCDGLVTVGWRYYFDPVNPTKVLFSIQHGSNTTQIDYIEMRRDTSSARHAKNVGSGYGYFVMPRDWFVQTVDDAALTAPVNIRFYFDPADSTAMQDAADAYSDQVRRTKGSVVWFKTNDQFSNGQIDATNGLTSEGGYAVMTPAGYGLESGLHYVQFNNIASFSGGGLGVGINGSLPVEWNDFSVSLQTDGSQLNWSTNLEQNSDFFAVERSVNGQVYETLGTVKAAGNTNLRTDYQYIDGGVWQIQEPRVYYRLRQVDVDGSFDYSNVVELTLNEEIGLGLEVYPNPASESFNLNVSGEQSRRMRITVRNAMGQKVYDREMSTPGSVFTYEINTLKWTAGFYHVSIEQNGVKRSVRLIIE